MRTWTATATMGAAPRAVLDVLTDPQACVRWAPVDFTVEALDGTRLQAGTHARVVGRLGGVEVCFDVDVLFAGDDRLELRATGPVDLDVAYELAAAEGGSHVHAAIGVRPGRGLRSRVLAQATGALLGAGALHAALDRIGREACSPLAA